MGVNLSLMETLLTFLLYETNLDDSIDSVNFFVRGYLPLTWKNSITHVYGLAVYVKVGVLFFQWNTSDSYLFFQQALLYSVPYISFFYWSPSLYLSTHFDTISSNIDEVFSSIHTSANIFVFGDLYVHHKDWLSYSTGTDRKKWENVGKQCREIFTKVGA